MVSTTATPAGPTSIIDTITTERDRLDVSATTLRDRIEADTVLLEQTEAERNRADAALAVFQSTPAPRRANFLTGRRG